MVARDEATHYVFSINERVTESDPISLDTELA